MSLITEDSSHMDQIFKSLADSTRRDILKRLVTKELSITEIADPYDLGYAAISKHLKVLEKANLVSRRRDGRNFLIQTNPDPLEKIDNWLAYYRNLWNDSFDRLEQVVETMRKSPKDKEEEINE